MPFYSSNRGALDKQKPIELVVELNSYAGGENTVGSDHELSLSESRRMENWDSISLGGMQRSYGFSTVASGVPLVGDPVFTGTGLDDVTASGSPAINEYISASGSMTHTAIILTEGTPDTFKWQKDSGAWASGISVPASGFMMSDDVYIVFGASTGHSADDEWEIPTNVPLSHSDFMIQAEASGSRNIFSVIEGDLYTKNDTQLLLNTEDAFTSGELCHGLSVNDRCFVTNSTDNLKMLVVDGGVGTPLDVPTKARDRIYYHKFRLIAEGGGKTVYGSRVQPGFWEAADAWSLTNDAWFMTMPDETQGMVIGFPSGDDVTVFTERASYSLSNFPNVAQKPLGSIGCSAPYSIAVGNEGAYFVSKFPNKAVFVWNGVGCADITENQEFVDDINFDYRIFGQYKGRKYYLFYASETTEAAYPDQCKVFDAVRNRWYTRKMNEDLSNSFGYPTVLGFTDNELYIGSAQDELIFELDGEDYTSDDGSDTVAVYETKDMSSIDFSLASGGDFPIDNVKMKLIKFSILSHGTDGIITINWTADRGKVTGSQTIDLNVTQSGDELNNDFIVNSSYIIARPNEPDKLFTKSFAHKAVGRNFSFQINNRDTGERPIIRKIKIHAIALEQQ